MFIVTKDRDKVGVAIGIEFEAGDSITDIFSTLRREIKHCDGVIYRNVRVDLLIQD